MRSHTLLSERQDLPRFHLTLIGRAKQVQGTGFRGHDIDFFAFFFHPTEDQGSEAVRVAHGHHFTLTEKDQRIGPTDLPERFDNAIDQGCAARGSDEMKDNLSVY